MRSVLAVVEGKGCVDLVKAPLRQLDRLDHRNRVPSAVQYHPLLADLGLGPLARRPARRPLLARQHQLGELVRQFRTIAKRESFE